ncbi:MAG: four helix bundle protein [Lepagella sp.]
MAIYTNLPIYKASYSLLLSLTKLMPSMSRDCRYTLGQDTRRKITDLIILIYRANRTHYKVKLIGEMREALLEVQVYLRLMSDMRYISERQYLAFAEQTESMSKQLAAWEKSERQKQEVEPGM